MVVLPKVTTQLLKWLKFSAPVTGQMFLGGWFDVRTSRMFRLRNRSRVRPARKLIPPLDAIAALLTLSIKI